MCFFNSNKMKRTLFFVSVLLIAIGCSVAAEQQRARSSGGLRSRETVQKTFVQAIAAEPTDDNSHFLNQPIGDVQKLENHAQLIESSNQNQKTVQVAETLQTKENTNVPLENERIERTNAQSAGQKHRKQHTHRPQQLDKPNKSSTKSKTSSNGRRRNNNNKNKAQQATDIEAAQSNHQQPKQKEHGALEKKHEKQKHKQQPAKETLDEQQAHNNQKANRNPNKHSKLQKQNTRERNTHPVVNKDRSKSHENTRSSNHSNSRGKQRHNVANKHHRKPHPQEEQAQSNENKEQLRQRRRANSQRYIHKIKKIKNYVN